MYVSSLASASSPQSEYHLQFPPHSKSSPFWTPNPLPLSGRLQRSDFAPNRTTDPGKGTAHKLRPSPSVWPQHQVSPSPEPEFLSFDEGNSSRIDYSLLQLSSKSFSGVSTSASPVLRPVLLPQTPPWTPSHSPLQTLSRTPSTLSPGSPPRASSSSNPAPRSPTRTLDLPSGNPVVTLPLCKVGCPAEATAEATDDEFRIGDGVAKPTEAIDPS
jgi:hypothetical protein